MLNKEKFIVGWFMAVAVLGPCQGGGANEGLPHKNEERESGDSPLVL